MSDAGQRKQIRDLERVVTSVRDLRLRRALDLIGLLRKSRRYWRELGDERVANAEFGEQAAYAASEQARAHWGRTRDEALTRMTERAKWAEARIEAVRKLHQPMTTHTGEGPYCTSCEGLTYPCATRLELDGSGA
mgnify:CR=1 FL=1